MIDSHCHLADSAFAGDLDAVVMRARQDGVSGALCPLSACDAEELARGRRAADLWPEVRFAAGVHPHQAGNVPGGVGAVEAVVRQALHDQPLVRAIGEIGLDYHYDFAPREVQREVFRRQLKLARQLGLPVVIHTREAEDDTFALLDEESGGKVPGVFHCFTGDRRMAAQALERGFHLSFSGILSFPRAGALREVARETPSERLLIETDSPYLAPVPFRGKRNEPRWVARVAEVVAGIRGSTAAGIGSLTAETYVDLFRP
jgi:TatD DNase family protein